MLLGKNIKYSCSHETSLFLVNLVCLLHTVCMVVEICGAFAHENDTHNYRDNGVQCFTHNVLDLYSKFCGQKVTVGTAISQSL